MKVKKVEEKTKGGIIMIEAVRENETAWQTEGEVVGIGSTAFKRKDGFCDGDAWCKVGDIVTFSRYGAVRTKTEDTEEHELWILMDKDILAIKETKENV